MTSVVIPAHNEARVIHRCLRALLADAEPGELEVVVVANGCTDDTAQQARRHRDVTVVELRQGSKPAALNAGDATATRFPRLYLDADVTLDRQAVRALAAAVQPQGPALAAAPALHLDTAHSSPLVRSYQQVWQRLPQIREGLMGRGAYLLSRAGRERFGAWPDLIADDALINERFTAAERAVVPAAVSTVTAERSVRELLHRKTRVFAGNRQLRATGGQQPGTSLAAWRQMLRASPALAVHVPVYLALNLLAKRRALRRDGEDSAWSTPRGD